MLPSAIVRILEPPRAWAEIMAEHAPALWARLGEPALLNSGAQAGLTLTPTAGVILQQAGLLTDDADGSIGLDGATGVVTVAGVPVLPAGGLTLLAWGVATVDKDAYFVVRSSAGYLRRVASSDAVVLSWSDGAGALHTLASPSGAFPADGTRRFVAGTVDAAGVARLYVNGAQVASTAAYSGHTPPASGSWYIGAASGAGSNQWAGRLDEVAIRGGAPLSAQAIAELYNAGAAIATADAIECEVLHASIRHGRDDPTSQPTADSATLELVGELPAAAVIGAAVTVHAIDPSDAAEYDRFAGRITDVAIGWDSVDVPTATLIAVGELADMGRRVIGDAPYPAELDGTRVNRAIAAAGVATDPIRSDPGYLTVLARDVDAKPALTIATDAAYDGGGIVWQATDGAVLYADAFHRRAPDLALELVACDLPLTLAWSQTLEGLANDVAVRYGVPAGGGEQPEVRDDDPSSIATYGTHAASLTTRIADVDDATERVNLILARQAAPAWVLSRLAFELQSPAVAAALTSDLLGLEVHDLLNVTGMPAGAPMPSAFVFVEGWTETLEPGRWALELVVSDYCRTAPAPQWDDTDPAWTWDTLDPAMTWDAITCLPPYLPGYPDRWVDVPSSQRWDTVGSVKWDEWAGRSRRRSNDAG